MNNIALDSNHNFLTITSTIALRCADHDLTER